MKTMSDLEWLKSKCIGTALHNFQIFNITDKYVHEICRNCAQEEAFSIVNGKTDNLNYLDFHLRSALTPNHPLYYAEFPNAKVQK